jgi:hypothetical protein
MDPSIRGLVSWPQAILPRDETGWGETLQAYNSRESASKQPLAGEDSGRAAARARRMNCVGVISNAPDMSDITSGEMGSGFKRSENDCAVRETIECTVHLPQAGM